MLQGAAQAKLCGEVLSEVSCRLYVGKLARWLRMMGHDTTYDVYLEDRELLEIAKFENRVLLTKDKELYKRSCKGIEGVLC